MPLDFRIQEILKRRGVSANLGGMSVADLRARSRDQIGVWREAGVVEYPVHRCEDATAAAGDRAVPVRIYWPSAEGKLPIVVYLHGGGWVTCDVDTHDGICRAICNRSGAIVVSVEYGRAPEHPFPQPLEDGAAALRWVAAHAASLGGNAGAIFLAGDSSGGNLASVLALEFTGTSRPSAAGQILIYPAVDDPGVAYPSVQEFWPTNDFGQNRDLYLRFVDLYLGKDVARNDPRFAPMRATTLRDCPPSLVLTAQYDLLRDEGEAYARRLALEGVAVEMRRYEQVNHGFLHLVGLLPAADEVIEQIAIWIRKHC
jgi:acetyl esterase/lipase